MASPVVSLQAPAAQEQELPTLLSARARQKHPWNRKRFPKASSLQISIPEPEQLEAYPAERVKVQNTFIHVASPTPESLERVAQSCPSTHIGRLRDVFNEEMGDESAKQVLCLEEVLFESMPSTPEPLQVGGMGVPPCAMSPEKLSQPRREMEWPTPGMLQEMGFPGQAPLAGHPDMNCWPMPPPQLGNYQHQMALPPQPMLFFWKCSAAKRLP